MLGCLIDCAAELKEADHRASFFVAKELSLIEISLMWYPEKLSDNVARLNSLADHVAVTFKDVGAALVANIRQVAHALAADPQQFIS